MIVNGKTMKCYEGQTIAQLLLQLKLDLNCVVVERNQKIVLKEAFETSVLDQRDVIEIVGFVGGG